jgi:hypothetical protein
MHGGPRLPEKTKSGDLNENNEWSEMPAFQLGGIGVRKDIVTLIKAVGRMKNSGRLSCPKFNHHKISSL